MLIREKDLEKFVSKAIIKIIRVKGFGKIVSKGKTGL
jgi:hypothetical protein